MAPNPTAAAAKKSQARIRQQLALKKRKQAEAAARKKAASARVTGGTTIGDQGGESSISDLVFGTLKEGPSTQTWQPRTIEQITADAKARAAAEITSANAKLSKDEDVKASWEFANQNMANLYAAYGKASGNQASAAGLAGFDASTIGFAEALDLRNNQRTRDAIEGSRGSIEQQLIAEALASDQETGLAVDKENQGAIGDWQDRLLEYYNTNRQDISSQNRDYAYAQSIDNQAKNDENRTLLLAKRLGLDISRFGLAKDVAADKSGLGWANVTLAKDRLAATKAHWIQQNQTQIAKIAASQGAAAAKARSALDQSVAGKLVTWLDSIGKSSSTKVDSGARTVTFLLDNNNEDRVSGQPTKITVPGADQMTPQQLENWAKAKWGSKWIDNVSSAVVNPSPIMEIGGSAGGLSRAQVRAGGIARVQAWYGPGKISKAQAAAMVDALLGNKAPKRTPKKPKGKTAPKGTGRK